MGPEISQRDLDQILENHGYQAESSAQPGYIHTGVNWGYTGAQLSGSMDPATFIAICAVLLLIIFTGYLIIYNVFQISVTNDIRFYGLLKTIGTTPRQLRRIIRHQALALSLAGIPLGLVLGWLIGGQLTPVIVRQAERSVQCGVNEPDHFCGLHPVFPGDRSSLLPQAGTNGRPGLPHRGGALHRGREPETQSQAQSQGRLPLLHGLGQPGPQPGQDGGHRPLSVPGGGAAHRDGHLHSGL